jgi:hypothetical protein
LIVVGVDHAGKDRARAHLPHTDYFSNPRMAEYAGKRLPHFLAGAAILLVDGCDRTLRGHDNTGIAGRSYDDVAALSARASSGPDIVARHGPARARRESARGDAGPGIHRLRRGASRTIRESSSK